MESKGLNRPLLFFLAVAGGGVYGHFFRQIVDNYDWGNRRNAQVLNQVV